MGTVTVTKELGLKTTHTKGQLAKVTGPIAEGKVNIDALTAIGQGNDAWFWFVTADNTKAKDLLSKAGFQVTERDCCCVELDNRPGTAFETATKIANAGINIDHLYFSTSTPGGGSARVYFSCDNCQKAVSVLG